MNEYKWQYMKDKLIKSINELDINNDDDLEMAKNLMLIVNTKFFETEEAANDNINIMNNYNWSKKKEK